MDERFALMAETAPIFARMAQIAGLKPKGAYKIGELSRASGMSYRTMCEAVSSGQIKSKLPPGRVRGKLVEPAWFDAWWEEL